MALEWKSHYEGKTHCLYLNDRIIVTIHHNKQSNDWSMFDDFNNYTPDSYQYNLPSLEQAKIIAEFRVNDFLRVYGLMIKPEFDPETYYR